MRQLLRFVFLPEYIFIILTSVHKKRQNVLTFKTRMHQNPLAGLRGAAPGSGRWGEKERGRGDRGWEEKGRGEDREMGGEEREGGRGGRRREGKEYLPRLRLSYGYVSGNRGQSRVNFSGTLN